MKKEFKTNDILEIKFSAAANGYDPYEVDEFLDIVYEDHVHLEDIISSLNSKLNASNDEYQKLEENYKIQNEKFAIYKNKYKNIKEDDFINNSSSIELIKKVNILLEEVKKLGGDPSKF